MNVAIFAVDPGGHTGIAWGVFNPHAKDIVEALGTRLLDGSTTITGNADDQAVEVCQLWQSFYNTSVKNAILPPDKVFLVCEDYVPRGGQSPGGKDSILPAFIIGGIEGYRRGTRDQWLKQRRGKATQVHVPPMVLQQAGEAFSFANKIRQKEWGIWVVGREHERSAWCHLALFLKKYMMGVENAARTRSKH